MIGGLGGWRLIVIGIRKPSVIPRRVDERIHRVGFTNRCRSAFWAINMFPCWMMIQRVTRPVEADVFWQCNRERRTRNRYCPAVFAVNDWYRASPISLSGDTPIAQSKMNFSRGLWCAMQILAFQMPGYCFFRVANRQAI